MLYWFSIGGLALLLFVWLSGLLKMLKGEDAQWCLDVGSEPDTLADGVSLGTLSIVVPARDEVANIERCVRAALAVDWPGELQVVVLDDRSTDGTGEVLARLTTEDTRLTVIEGADPPKGWLGKPHALHRAQAAATGDWLLFIDADVTIDPLGPRRLFSRMTNQGAVMASALGMLEVESFWERVVQTRMGGVIASGNPLNEVNDPEHERAMANGQCLAFSRVAYDALGGHEAIKGSVLDDVDFAKRAKAEQVVYRLYNGAGVFKCRMYTGLGEIWSGWTKNLFPALDYSVKLTASVTLMLSLASLLPFVLLAKSALVMAFGGHISPSVLALEAAICATIFVTDAVAHHKNGYKWGLFWTFPLGMAVVVAVFWHSAWRIGSGRGAVWKGRVVEAGRPGKKS